MPASRPLTARKWAASRSSSTGQPLAVRGQLQQRGVQRVGGHGQLHGNAAPPGPARSSGTSSGTLSAGTAASAVIRGRGRRGERGDRLAGAAGAFVGGVFPRGREPGDDGRVAAADHQREPGGQLADHLRGGDRGGGWSGPRRAPPGGVAAQLADAASRVRGVGDAGQEHLDRGGVQDDLLAVLAPPARQLRLAVRDGADLDALAAGVATARPAAGRGRSG